MSTAEIVRPAEGVKPRPVPAGRSATAATLLYFGLLTLATGMMSPGGLIGLPVQFFLKDRLHVGPQAMAVFGLVASIPFFLGFLAGLVRDRWRLGALGDRGYLLLGAPGVVAVYVWLAAGRITFGKLLAGVLVATAVFQLVVTAMQGLTTVVAQRDLLSGRLSAVTNLMGLLPALASSLLGGWLVSRMSAPGVLRLAALLGMAVFGLAMWRPRSVYAGTAPGTQRARAGTMARLVRHRPFWLAMAVWAMWSFAPGAGTPLFYFATDKLRLSSETFGVMMAVTTLGFATLTPVYGLLCRRWPLRSLLYGSTLFAIPQLVPLLFIHGAGQAMWAGYAMGLMGGLATAAYFDLLMRACPRGAEGTGMSLAMAASWATARGGDLLGTWLYGHGGFLASVVATTTVYALILPVLASVPRGLTASRDGEEERTAPGDGRSDAGTPPVAAAAVLP